MEPNPRRSTAWRRGRAVALALLVLLVLSAAGLAALAGCWRRGFFRGYDGDLPLRPRILERTAIAPGHRRELLTFQAAPGEDALALFHYPSGAAAPAPCIVMLLWYQAKISYLEPAAERFVRQGFAVVSPEGLGLSGHGQPRSKRTLARHLSVLAAGRRTMIQSRRILDYLASRPEIDPDRLYLGGVSLGAILAPAVLAHEPRYRAGVLMWGAADLERIVDRYVERKRPNPGQRALLALSTFVLEPAEPLRWVGKLGSTPILFQNARSDDLLPADAIAALHEGVKGPKTILWYDSVHEKTVEEAVVQQAIDDQILWLRQLEGEGGDPLDREGG